MTYPPGHAGPGHAGSGHSGPPGHPDLPVLPGPPAAEAPTGRPDTAERKRKTARGFGLASLIVGLVALLLCWVPVVNLLLIPVGLAGAVLAAVALFLGRHGRGGRGLAVSGLLLSVAGGVGAGLAHMYYSSLVDTAVQSLEQAHEDYVEAYNEARDGSTDIAFDVGDTLKVDDYHVSVTAADTTKTTGTDGEADGYNTSVLLSVRNIGDAGADPALDLAVGLRGADGTRYDAAPCRDRAGAPHDVGRLAPEQTAELRMCVQAPPSAFEHGGFGADDVAVYVAPVDLASERQRIHWLIDAQDEP